MISLARKTLRHEWRRFLPAVVAVGVSGVLLTIQAALVLGIFGSAAIYVTASSADLWAGYPGTQSVNFGRAIGPDVAMRLSMDPDVVQVESYVWVDGDWHGLSPGGGAVSVYVSGIETRQDGMLFSRVLAPGQRRLLDEPGAVIVDRAELVQLGTAPNGIAWINGKRVRVAAAVSGLRGLGGVNVIASRQTAHSLQSDSGKHGTTYYLARLRPGADPVLTQARQSADARFGPFEVWTARQFASRSQRYWLFDTGAGVAVLFMAAIVLLVGTAIASQSLMAVVAASAREYAVLNALGVSRRALGRVVIEQSFWIGALGMAFATLACVALLGLAESQGVPVAMNLPVALVCAALVLGLALASGLVAIRGLMRADPALLLR